MTPREKIERMTAIKEEIKGLVDEAYSLVHGSREQAVARAYWRGHILCALDQEHDYAARQRGTLQESIDSLAEQAEIEEAPCAHSGAGDVCELCGEVLVS